MNDTIKKKYRYHCDTVRDSGWEKISDADDVNEFAEEDEEDGDGSTMSTSSE